MGRPDVHDPTVYPEEERVGEEMLQRWIVELLRPLLERAFAEGRSTTFVGADQFIYYRRHEPTARFAPDLYVIPGLPPDTRVRSWKVWEHPETVSFALEVVSGDWRKDYEEAPERCGDAGVGELVIFDPSAGERPHGQGVRFQRYARTDEGAFRLVERTNDDRIRAEALGAWLRSVGFGDRTRLRLATGPSGDALFPTEAEHQRAEKERERAEKEREQAEKERERAEKEAALARIRELESRLAED